MISFIKRIIPTSIKGFVRKVIMAFRLFKVKREQLTALKKLKEKDKINCIFFALFEEVWKYEYVYRLMVNHSRFNPIILVCPIVNYGKENMISRMDQCFHTFQKKGYNVVLSYDKINDTYVDVRSSLKPDIIFYTNPYNGLIDDRYYITNFLDVLTVYVPYFMNSNKDYQMACNLEMHNLVWRRYSGTEFHRQLSIKYASNKGINVVNSGYPGIEAFLNFKTQQRKDGRKCIIWAPHHTIEPVGIIFYSCFLKYCDYMIEMAMKYFEHVFIIFKPHPLLRNKLYEKWGNEKTDEYYNLWKRMENTSLNEGEYEELFIESDAMIHDSASFIVEYLYLNKPVMRTMNGEDINTMYNSFGLQCIDNHYKAFNEQDIEHFIQDVINGVDPLKEQRTKFVNEVLMPKGSPSQNIIDDILDSIDNQILYRN